MPTGGRSTILEIAQLQEGVVGYVVEVGQEVVQDDGVSTGGDPRPVVQRVEQVTPADVVESVQMTLTLFDRPAVLGRETIGDGLDGVFLVQTELKVKCRVCELSAGGCSVRR